MEKIKEFINMYLFTVSYDVGRKLAITNIIVDLLFYVCVLPYSIALMITGNFFTGWILFLFVVAMFLLQCYKVIVIRDKVVLNFIANMYKESPRYNFNGVLEMANKHADEVMKKRNSKKV